MEIYPTENHIKFSFDSEGVDIDEVICKANQFINMKPQCCNANNYYDIEGDYDLDSNDAKLFILDHNTTQGVVIGKYDETVMQIVIPALSSEPDIVYAFSLVNALKELYPDVSIRKGDVISDFSEIGITEAIAHCRNNMRIYLTADVDDDDYDWNYLIQGYSIGTVITIDMLKKQFSISDEDVDIDRMVDLSFAILCQLQWTAAVLPHAEHSELPAKYPHCNKDSSMDYVVTILNGNMFVEVSWCKIFLSINGQCKAVSHEDFYTAALRCDKIQVFTDGQYAITEMTPEEWAYFCESVPGKLFDAPKTFILRWNPAVSSLSRKRYSHCLKEYGEN